jgi:PD-(D/E)XK endonuclease
VAWGYARTRLCPTSAGSIRIVKRRVSGLGLDTAHFSGQRRWPDVQLRRAVASAYSWAEVLSELGLTGNADDRVRVKANSARLRLDLSRLDPPLKGAPGQQEFKPDIKHLRDAGTSIAAMWFLLCGYNTSLPMEPTIYDLLVSMPDGIKRVQVKTTTYNNNGHVVQVGRRPYSVGNRARLVPYDPDEVDFFFIVDGDLTMYLIPSRVIAGRVGILLGNYSEFIVGSAAFFMQKSNAAA